MHGLTANMIRSFVPATTFGQRQKSDIIKMQVFHLCMRISDFDLTFWNH